MTEVVIKEINFKIPASIITTDITLSEEYKQKCLDAVYSLGDTMNRETNLKADMSSYELHKQTPILNDLIDKINKMSNFCPWLLHRNCRYELNSLWSGVYKKGDYAVSHWHLPASISFCYYLKANPYKSAPLIFDGSDIFIRPYDGLCVFFPSHLLHSVPEQIDEDTRVVIAGNYDAKM